MKKIVSYILAFIAYALSANHLAFVVGSKACFFSISQILAPLVGVYGGLHATLANYAVRTLLYVSGVFLNPITLSTWLLVVSYHIPTTLASAYLSTNSRIKIIVPILALIAYFAHPIGMQAPWYALYWLIPIITAFIPVFFAQALGATFVAHAAGTIIYLYAGKLSYQAIVMLTPIVLVERLTYALGITITFYAFNYASLFIKNLTLQPKAQEQVA
jgi:hypothetical protein